MITETVALMLVDNLEKDKGQAGSNLRFCTGITVPIGKRAVNHWRIFLRHQVIDEACQAPDSAWEEDRAVC